MFATLYKGVLHLRLAHLCIGFTFFKAFLWLNQLNRLNTILNMLRLLSRFNGSSKFNDHTTIRWRYILIGLTWKASYLWGRDSLSLFHWCLLYNCILYLLSCLWKELLTTLTKCWCVFVIPELVILGLHVLGKHLEELLLLLVLGNLMKKSLGHTLLILDHFLLLHWKGLSGLLAPLSGQRNCFEYALVRLLNLVRLSHFILDWL